MKLSQLSTDEALNVLCEITPYVSNITEDKDVMETIGTAISTDGLTKIGVTIAAADRFTKLIPVLLKTHRDDVYGIVATVNGMDVEDIKKQNIIKTMGQVRDVFRDKELLDFFKSFGSPVASE